MLLESFKQFLPVLILLFAIGLVIARLPKLDLGHSKAFRARRLMNWLPLGLTYAFLYMGRYNLTVSKNAFGEDEPGQNWNTISSIINGDENSGLFGGAVKRHGNYLFVSQEFYNSSFSYVN